MEEMGNQSLPIYRHRQQWQNRWIKSRPKSMAGITHINEETGRVGIKGAVSKKSVPPSHEPYSSEMGEIFPEKAAQKVKRHALDSTSHFARINAPQAIIIMNG